MALLSLAFKSLFNRKLSFFITLFAIAISVALLLGVQTLNSETKNSFMKSISGTDLIIGSRGASSQLLLSSVFHIGTSTNTIKYKTYQEIAKSPAVKWAVPISLGDSHRGYTVMATELNFFDHYSYANKQYLSVQQGEISDDMYAVVIGADVAKKLNYRIGDRIVMTHGNGAIDGHAHDHIPYFVSAILQASFTAIDQTLIISLEAMEAMHSDTDDYFSALSNEITTEPLAKAEEQVDHSDHHHASSHADDLHDHHEGHDADDHTNHDSHASHHYQDTPEQRVARLLQLKPEKINAIFVGLTSRQAVLGMQNYVNNFSAEPLTAIMPTVALQELWQFFSIAEVALNIVSAFIVVVGLLGMLSILLMSLNERRREMAILRSVGARPIHIFGLIIGEAAFVCFAGIVLGIALLYLLLFTLQVPLANYFGFYLDINPLTLNDYLILLTIQISALLIALLPASLIYKYSLSDGMIIRF
ncbi:ABC transporter permease [Vibrio vulnificus]|uniref:ABC transporter permease n=1 Tax=Vibrio TaxID=662 RepID=UPI0009B6DB32|nr:FtsX-like permease family protein [Vibrio vulnificus]ELJ8616148.1 ABC transporter permease [Vibrio cholerae]ELJ8695227.1 ABC transporter permease [Vibrio cholerae]OQK60955.1 peptide ABC transporter permease [Vibrio vulnificus]OQK63737.1 peptide ABC transporter permease [Vibrio vulnificus]